MLSALGGLLSSGITYGTAKIPTTWAWRIPSILQILFMVLAVCVLPWIPESPRWLVYQDRHSEALDAIALTHSDGNREDPVVLLTYQEIIDTLQTEVELGQQTGYRDLVKSKSSMRRVMLVISVAAISMVSGKIHQAFANLMGVELIFVVQETTLSHSILEQCWITLVSPTVPRSWKL